jgi:hypothetical protein
LRISFRQKAILIWEEVMPTLAGFNTFAALPEEQISEKISRRILAGDQGMLVWWSIGAGVHVEPHSREWLHEIKHDGFRVIARKDGPRVRLYSRPGNDLTHRFPLIVHALGRLGSRSCIIDGEAVGCDANGVPLNMVRYRRQEESIFLPLT